MGKRKARRPRGRPPGPPERVRSQRVVTYVTPAEWAQLERLADERDEGISLIVYAFLARALRRQRTGKLGR